MYGVDDPNRARLKVVLGRNPDGVALVVVRHVRRVVDLDNRTTGRVDVRQVRRVRLVHIRHIA